MNKILRFALIMVIALNTTSAFSAKSDDREISAPAKEEKLTKEEIKALKLRLKEMRDIDMSQLTPEGKQELRKEVLTIKEELRKSSHVVIISTTALFLIILLIVLL